MQGSRGPRGPWPHHMAALWTRWERGPSRPHSGCLGGLFRPVVSGIRAVSRGPRYLPPIHGVSQAAGVWASGRAPCEPHRPVFAGWPAVGSEQPPRSGGGRLAPLRASQPRSRGPALGRRSAAAALTVNPRCLSRRSRPSSWLSPCRLPSARPHRALAAIPPRSGLMPSSQGCVGRGRKQSREWGGGGRGGEGRSGPGRAGAGQRRARPGPRSPLLFEWVSAPPSLPPRPGPHPHPRSREDSAGIPWKRSGRTFSEMF